ncbi:response regulator [Aggregatimonas sangjinii]|uniref:histidine kinase n=1 Tax=Aggregatimonas sangjinii TaxID=2583587 RepID=A0A5B7SNI0_9FLAO|nr:response regulator [Aggregatimonas sangjinii]QCX00077.1 response regulator [Aggregatimonas sangjinii]
MRPKELLSKITHVASLLNEFSVAESDSDEADALSRAFENFTEQLEAIIAAESIVANSSTETLNAEKEEVYSRSMEGLSVADIREKLSTHLKKVLNFTDPINADEPDTPRLQRAQMLKSESNSLIEFIDELTEYSKLVLGQEKFANIDFNFHRLMGDVVFLSKTLIVQKNVSLEFVMDSAVPEVLVGDPAKLSQVLLKLLSWTMKCVDEGAIHFEVRLKKKTKDKLFLEFTISDNGIGVEAKAVPFLFDAFPPAGTSKSDALKGSGLGLAIVKQIVTHLDGAVSAGVGTTFKCCLPYTAGDKGKLRKNDTAREYLLEAAKLIKGTRILVFEDNPINQRFIRQRLKKWDCPVFVTDDGIYGLNLLEEQKIDMILMDLNMPVMSGLEITERIRSHASPSIRQLPIIALTADFTIQDKKKSEAHGINDYLLKPYSPDGLLLKLLANKNKTELKSKLSEPIAATYAAKIKKPKVFNLDPIFKDCMGQMDLVIELVRLYRQNALEFIGETKFQLLQKDFQPLEFSLHKMKSGLAMMRTNDLLDIVEQMQKCCKSDRDLKHLNFLYGCFVTQYPITQSKIDSEVKRLQKKQ